MDNSADNKPCVFNIPQGEALEIKDTPFGQVGTVYQGEEIEAFWVKKQDEEVDPDWFSQSKVDLILVVQGRLRVEFEQAELDSRILEPGDLLVLPPTARCRAYRWPRDAQKGTVFLAVYPTTSGVVQSH